MPVFNDPHFPKPGEKLTVSQTIAKLRAESEARRRSNTYGATAIAAPLKERAQIKLADIEAPPRLEKAVEPAKPAANPNQPSLEVLTQELYNPYARTTRLKAKTKAKAKSQTTSSDLGLYALVGVFVFAGALLLSTFFVQKMAERQIAKAIHKAAASFAETATVQFSGVSVSLFKQTVSVRNLQITLAKNDETITIDRASVWGLDWPTLKQMAMTRKPVIPKTMKLALTNVRANAEILGPQVATALHAMGYKDLAFTASTDLAVTKKNFDLKNFYVDARKMGRMSVSLSLGNLTMPNAQELARLKKDPKLFLTESGDFTKATIRGFSVAFEDQTITRRVINWLEHQGETSPESLAKMALAINSDVRNPASIDFVKPALITLIKFFQKPTSITLTAQPPNEVSVLSLLDEKKGGSVNELAHKLNLTFE